MNSSVAALASCVKDWVIAHPYLSAGQVASILIFRHPALVTIPFFNTIGLTAIGPASGSIASGFMSYVGVVPPSGVFATMQSASMGGQSAPLVASVVQGVAVASSAVLGWMGASGSANSSQTIG